jgi:hypothetical protein
MRHVFLKDVQVMDSIKFRLAAGTSQQEVNLISLKNNNFLPYRKCSKIYKESDLRS